MLFNSSAFLFAFLPATLALFFLFAKFGHRVAIAWLTLASLFFYAWWNPVWLPLLLASIGFNFLAGREISQRAKSRRLLTFAISVNLVALVYFKYGAFLVESVAALLGSSYRWQASELPLGISFFTFTQIAFLVDVYQRRASDLDPVRYSLFVTYFPHLIAGPVLHHKEMMPQFDEDSNYRPQPSFIAVGVTYFAIGLAKKVLIADNLAGFAAPVFLPLAEAPTLFHAWGGALAYAFQLYFDFSGYSDMAIGLSLLFGVRLPLNFDSPYRAHNIIEFWRRWHMTLSRFLRDYLYIPLGGNRHGTLRRHLYLATTMLLGGLWHGAGWNFVIWGALHGAFLIVNHGWQDLCLRSGLRAPAALTRPLSIALTFVAVVFAWVYFRAPDLATANRLVLAMLGQQGVSLPASLLAQWGPLGAWLQGAGVEAALGGGSAFVQTCAWVMAAAAIAFLAPNSQQIMAGAQATLTAAAPGRPGAVALRWQPRRRDAVLGGLLLAAGLLALSRPTEFLYFQF